MLGWLVRVQHLRGRAERGERQPSNDQERSSERGDAMEQHGGTGGEADGRGSYASNLGGRCALRKRVGVHRTVG
jgi:hypothetical protein